MSGAILEAASDLRCLQCWCIEPGPMLSTLQTLFHLIIMTLFIDEETEAGAGVGCRFLN